MNQMIRVNAKLGEQLQRVVQQAVHNHATYSDQGDQRKNVIFLALGMVGEAGECANFVKKLMRDGRRPEDIEVYRHDIATEAADTIIYGIMTALELGYTMEGLLSIIENKQQAFVRKMEALRAEHGEA